MASSTKKKRYVIMKQGKFATVGGGLGSRPKVYDTATAAQYDIKSNSRLKGGSVQPYVDPDVPVEAGLPTASTSKDKAKAGTTKAPPKKAATGM